MSDSKVTIKTAQAWGYADPQPIDALRPMAWASRDKYGDDIPVVIVHGLTEAEVHEAAGLLARRREVCECKRHADTTGIVLCNGDVVWEIDDGDFCPSCGRRVVIKE